MKKIFTSLFFTIVFATSFAQWTSTAMRGEDLKPNSSTDQYYSLDIKQIRNTLKSAQETGRNAKPTVVSIPTLDGKIEKFAVYSFPVVVESLADRFQLGSYVGVGIDDPTKYVRFSVAPNDFQSMIIHNGKYQFIEPQNKDKSVYGVHEKSVNSGSKAFVCSTTEPLPLKQDMDKLYKAGNNFGNQPTNFSKSSDRKYRTLRLALSVTGEYTTLFGGVGPALVQMNATMTRVNGVFEKDFALHLNLQDFPQLIYSNAASDPYSDSDVGVNGAWNTELQNTLTSVIGNTAYDIGHLFGATGGGGSAGCIGCICVDDTASETDTNKGSAYTSPADANPFGDKFDIDYVAHEMGHQLGGNHTFSHRLEGANVNVEPGSGSTIMGYAGITGAADVQQSSDAYFSIVSIIQVQNNLVAKTCDVEVTIPNTPPVIAALPSVTIPKSTAFVLKAEASDAENDPLTYTWEEVDNARVTITKTNLGNTTTGASFRSLPPSADPVRYFPKLTTVLSGNLKKLSDWEAVSTVARASNFRITVRDNNTSSPGYQQTQSALQSVSVGSDGPFTVTSTKVFNNNAGPFIWDVVNTSQAPYNVTNVKIDYTEDNGISWTVIAASTPNDGSENLIFASVPTGNSVIVRVSAIGNVFYAVKSVLVTLLPPCDGTPPPNVIASKPTTNGATINWDPVNGATYVIRYRKTGTTTWTTVSSADTFITLVNLEEGTQYEAQVAAVCSGTTGNYSSSVTFTTLNLGYCPLASGSSDLEYISNVTVKPEGGTAISNSSGSSKYTSYAADPSKIINLVANTTNNTISVTKMWSGSIYDEAVFAWIDFNRNGVFDTNERIMATARDRTTPVTVTFSVPADAYVGDKTVGMRVILTDKAAQATACTAFAYGEVEDYAVKIASSLSTEESNASESIQVYPNPAVDILNITKVPNNAAYSIYNMAGQIVVTGKVLNNKVAISRLTPGLYIISLHNKGEITRVKFIKK